MLTDGEPQVVSSTLVIAAVQRVMLIVFTGNTTVADIDAVIAASIELSRARPDGIGHLNYVATTDQPSGLDEGVRQRLTALLRDERVKLNASAVVFPGGGFQAAVVRGILSGLILLSRTRAKIRVHPSVEAGASWLCDSLDANGTPTQAALCRAMERARSAGGASNGSKRTP